MERNRILEKAYERGINPLPDLRRRLMEAGWYWPVQYYCWPSQMTVCAKTRMMVVAHNSETGEVVTEELLSGETFRL